MPAAYFLWGLRKLFEACQKHRGGLRKFGWLEMCCCVLL